MNLLQTYQPKQPPEVRLAPLPGNSPAIYPYATTAMGNSWTPRDKMILGVILAAGVGGGIWFVRKAYFNRVADKEQLKSFDEGTPATTAKMIKMAFENDGYGWFRADMDTLRETLISVPSQEDWQLIIKSYDTQFRSNLITDLKEKLQTTENKEMMAIINAKPLKKGQAAQGNQFRAWAKRLKAAFDKDYGFLPGTDGVAVTVALREIPTQSAFIKVGVEYQNLYGNKLFDDLKAEGEFGQYDEWLKIIVDKRKS